MTIQHPSCLSGEVHLHVKDHVSSNFVPSVRCNGPLTQDFKCNSIISYFSLNGISPECITILTIIFYACSTLVSISIPYLCVVLRIRRLTVDKMIYRFFRVYGTHHINTASSEMPLVRAYSARSTGYDSFKSVSGIHDSLSSIHSTKSFQLVVILLSLLCPQEVIMYISCLDMAVVSSLL